MIPVVRLTIVYVHAERLIITTGSSLEGNWCSAKGATNLKVLAVHPWTPFRTRYSCQHYSKEKATPLVIYRNFHHEISIILGQLLAVNIRSVVDVKQNRIAVDAIIHEPQLETIESHLLLFCPRTSCILVSIQVE